VKQASLQWNKKLHPVLIAWGFLQSLADPCLYVFHNQTDFVILVVYVDNFIGAANSNTAWQKLVSHITHQIKDLAQLSHAHALG
jgi:hypothetical protein